MVERKGEMGGGGGGWNEARVGKIYFTKNPNEKKKKYFFRCVYGGGGGGGARVSDFFYKESK